MQSDAFYALFATVNGIVKLNRRNAGGKRIIGVLIKFLKLSVPFQIQVVKTENAVEK